MSLVEQRLGVGGRLLLELSRHAAGDGITHFTASILADSRAVLGLMRHSGWDIATTLDGPYADVVVALPEALTGAARVGGWRMPVD